MERLLAYTHPDPATEEGRRLSLEERKERQGGGSRVWRRGAGAGQLRSTQKRH